MTEIPVTLYYEQKTSASGQEMLDIYGNLESAARVVSAAYRHIDIHVKNSTGTPTVSIGKTDETADLDRAVSDFIFLAGMPPTLAPADREFINNALGRTE